LSQFVEKSAGTRQGRRGTVDLGIIVVVEPCANDLSIEKQSQQMMLATSASTTTATTTNPRERTRSRAGSKAAVCVSFIRQFLLCVPPLWSILLVSFFSFFVFFSFFFRLFFSTFVSFGIMNLFISSFLNALATRDQTRRRERERTTEADSDRCVRGQFLWVEFRGTIRRRRQPAV
jgi:ABC-type protease/lipase transport system fused ATPase/permease subunit